jgi:hypothetical protein
MQDMGGGHPMKGSVDIRYMIDVGLKGGVLVERRRIHTRRKDRYPAAGSGQIRV